MSDPTVDPEVLARERKHHDQLYSGFAQQHFASPAVVSFRKDFVQRLIRRTGLTRTCRVLSLGCGIGDVELLLSPMVEFITGIDVSPPGIAQARADAAAAHVRNVEFLESSFDDPELEKRLQRFDLVLAKFFFHHLPPAALAAAPLRIRSWLREGGCVYSLDPSRYRLLGWIGQRVIPKKMAAYQTEDESPLAAADLHRVFGKAGFDVETRMYDYFSTPLAGLFPRWRSGYRAARLADDLLTRIPLLSRSASSVEMLARLR